ncbi:MAG: type I-E CRISPR-associated protein Cas5/CasD [Fimbriimonadales bacterium]|nr:type I-E CRISPR-associated protein Cas5/CasD [Fimbriimonadales bacterium]
MSVLLLRLQGPLQSWGHRSRFTDRDTAMEPTKSAVIGMLCCALGRDRAADVSDLAALRMHVRVDRQGTLLSDYQTAGGGVFRGSTEYFAPKSDGSGLSENPVVLTKHYLQDAEFLVALEGPPELLQTLGSALQDPVWPLSLGRRSCPPTAPVFLGFFEGSAEEALATARLQSEDDADRPEDGSDGKLRVVFEVSPNDASGEARWDVPVAWADSLNRRYAVRRLRHGVVDRPARES